MKIDEKAISTATEIENKYSKCGGDFDRVAGLRKQNAAADWILIKITYDPALVIEEAKKIYWDKTTERKTSGWYHESVAYQNMEWQFYSALPYFDAEGGGPLQTLESDEQKNEDIVAIRPQFFLSSLVAEQKYRPEIKTIDLLDSGQTVHAKVISKGPRFPGGY